MTLADACTGYFSSTGSLPEAPSTEGALNTCDTIAANGWDWDTPIPCSPTADAYYTMRGVFTATDAMITAMNAVPQGAANAATTTVLMTQTHDYIDGACHGSRRNLLADLSPEQRKLSVASALDYGPCSIALGFSFLSAVGVS